MLTPDERRGTLTLVVLLLAGACWDLLHAGHPARSRPVEAPPAIARADSAGASGAGLGEPPAAAPAGASPVATAPIDLNRAGRSELESLPGIGPVLARRICEHRAHQGPFRSIEELGAVRGIGPRLLERLRGRVVALPWP